MNLYLIEQEVNNIYDTYDSAVVAAESEEEARNIHPSEFYKSHKNGWLFRDSNPREVEETTYDWCSKSDVQVRLIGTTETEESGTVICASFNAG